MKFKNIQLQLYNLFLWCLIASLIWKSCDFFSSYIGGVIGIAMLNNGIKKIWINILIMIAMYVISCIFVCDLAFGWAINVVSFAVLKGFRE